MSAKRMQKCEVCSKRYSQQDICQYCMLSVKISDKSDSIGGGPLSHSNDPDLTKKLNKLEKVVHNASEYRISKEENLNKSDRSLRKDQTFSLDFNNSIVYDEEEEDDEGDSEAETHCHDDKKSNFIIKEESDIEHEYVKSLPSGWKVVKLKVGNGSVINHFVDTSGKRYISRIEAIKSLVKNGGSEEDIAILKAGMVCDGWISHHLLPYGWMAKSSNKAFRFLTDKNEWFMGIRNAIKLMNNSEEYTAVDVENFHTFIGDYTSSKRVLSHAMFLKVLKS